MAIYFWVRGGLNKIIFKHYKNKIQSDRLPEIICTQVEKNYYHRFYNIQISHGIGLFGDYFYIYFYCR